MNVSDKLHEIINLIILKAPAKWILFWCFTSQVNSYGHCGTVLQNEYKSRLLHLFAYIIDLCKYRAKKCGPRSDMLVGEVSKTPADDKADYFCWDRPFMGNVNDINFTYTTPYWLVLRFE